MDRRAFAIVLLAVSIAFLIPNWDHPERWRLETARGFGWSATIVLLLSASCTPLGVFWGWRTGRSTRLHKERRMFGLVALGLGVLHLVSLLPALSILHLLDHSLTRSGFAALVTLSLLGVTSFPGVTRKLYVREWRSLHRMVYLAWGFVAVHVLAAPRGPLDLVGITVLVTSLAVTLRLASWTWSHLSA